jgi:uncharacterized protein YcaQ
LLDDMHYRGMLRVVKRARGTRIYAAHTYPAQAAAGGQDNPPLDALIDVIVRTYAPLPARSLDGLVRRLRIGTPQWSAEIPAALRRAKARLNHAAVEGVEWYWPTDEDPRAHGDAPGGRVHVLTPFDPIVWDRLRFELFWGWTYRFEAYTPAAKRKLGYYALPLLWQHRVIGWGNVRVEDSGLIADFGYVAGRAPQGRVFRQALEEELERLRTFLSLGEADL